MENGTEYTIISIALNIDKKILRLIQGFDFTKKNPKLIYIITGETVLSLEDTIFATYLSQIGFDVLFLYLQGISQLKSFLMETIWRNIRLEHICMIYRFQT